MKLNVLAFTTVIAVSLLFTGCASTEPAADVTPLNGADETASMLEDLNYLTETLEKSHKNLYATVTKETFIAEKDRIAAEIPHMTDADFYFSLKGLVALAGDAHTTINYTDSIYKHLLTLPFAIEKYGDDWHLMMIDEFNEKHLGSKLVAINDVPIEEIYEMSKALISHENEAWALSQFSTTIAFKEALNYLGVVEGDDKVMLSVVTGDGENVSFELAALTEATLMGAEIEVFEGETVTQTWPQGMYRALSLDDAHLMIQYNVCQESTDLPMATFTDTIKKELTDKNYQAVVIDLRYNSGGNSKVFRPMLDMIKALKNEKDLEIYTLIGKNTMSSAIINAIQTKDELGSTLVGAATGGSVNGYGEIETFELKNHPFGVTYSTKYFELIKGYDKGSLLPDFEVSQTLEDYVNGIDTEVQWLLNK